MRRRRFLASASGGLALLSGCVDLPVAGSSRSLRRRVTLTASDDIADDHDVRIEAELLDAAVTPDSTARVRVTSTNVGRRRRISIAEDGCSLFNRAGGASDPPGLWLHPPERSRHIDRRGDRWTRDAPADESRVFDAYGCSRRVYEPRGSVSNEYLVWDDYRVDGYMPPGSYRFDEPVSVAEPGAGDASDLLAEFTWGFTLEVSRP